MKSFIATTYCALTLAACGASTPSAIPVDGAKGALTVQSYTASEKGVFVTSSLILSEHEAILIDAQFLNSDAQKVVDLIHESGRQLKSIYLTHAHPDHSFGLAVIQAAFPEARVLAAPMVKGEMKASFEPKHAFWKPIFGADLTDTEVVPTAYDSPTMTLEGREIKLLGPQQGDIDHTVSVYVPDAKTLITGDVSFSGTHVWLADSKAPEWEAWLATLTELEALHPTTVISGHHDPDQPNAPTDLSATAQYIRDFRDVVATSHSADEVVQAMTAKYPTRKLAMVLSIAAGAAFPK